MTTRRFLLAAVLAACGSIYMGGGHPAVAETADKPILLLGTPNSTAAAAQWPAGKSYALGNLVVEISKPLCVGRSA